MGQQETFTKTFFGGGARSSAGYRVFFNSRTAVEYVDAVDRTFVSAEVLTGRMSMALYPETMRVGTRSGPLLAGETRRTLVLERVKLAASYLGWKLE